LIDCEKLDDPLAREEDKIDENGRHHHHHHHHHHGHHQPASVVSEPTAEELLAMEAARKDGAWNNFVTVQAAMRLADAMEFRAENHPGVLLGESEALLDEAQDLRMAVATRLQVS
jgi:G3E family GTPase